MPSLAIIAQLLTRIMKVIIRLPILTKFVQSSQKYKKKTMWSSQFIYKIQQLFI